MMGRPLWIQIVNRQLVLSPISVSCIEETEVAQTMHSYVSRNRFAGQFGPSLFIDFFMRLFRSDYRLP